MSSKGLDLRYVQRTVFAAFFRRACSLFFGTFACLKILKVSYLEGKRQTKALGKAGKGPSVFATIQDDSLDSFEVILCNNTIFILDSQEL